MIKSLESVESVLLDVVVGVDDVSVFSKLLNFSIRSLNSPKKYESLRMNALMGFNSKSEIYMYILNAAGYFGSEVFLELLVGDDFKI